MVSKEVEEVEEEDLAVVATTVARRDTWPGSAQKANARGPAMLAGSQATSLVIALLPQVAMLTNPPILILKEIVTSATNLVTLLGTALRLFKGSHLYIFSPVFFHS